jgi:hypothetical protein
MNTNINNEFSYDEEMEARIWAYIDGLSEEENFIEQLIKENAKWRTKYQQLLELNQLLQDTELEQPSMRFTKNVMEEISRIHIAPATKEYINKNIIRGIAAFFITVIVGFLVYGFSQVDWSAGNPGNPVGIDFTQVDYSRMFNNTFVNLFMMVNIILGLMLLDRYLTSKKKQWQ